MAPPPVDTAVLKVADAVGALMEAWGFKRNMGRLWTVLYLESRPLSAAEIGERLSLSAGAVSMLLTEMQEWGVIKKAWVPGERREYFEPETNIWKPVSRVFRERELQWITTAVESFDAAKTQLDGVPIADDARAKLITERVAGLAALARVGAHVLDAILSGESIDTLPIKAVAELAQDAQANKK